LIIASVLIVGDRHAALYGRGAPVRMTPLCGYCPFFSNKKLSFMSRQIQRVAHMAASQVHTVEAVGEFLGEADSHTTGKGKGRARQKGARWPACGA
jgi:hypothetical protein